MQCAVVDEAQVDLGEIIGLHDSVSRPLFEPIWKQRTCGIGIDRTIDHDVTDMNALRPKLARHALSKGTQRSLPPAKAA